MKVKSFISLLLGLMLCGTIAAQDNPGVVLLKLGELDLAKQHFMKQLRQQPADAYYYLGEVAWEEGNIAEAKSNFAKAIESNPESPFSQVGSLKAQMQGLSADSKEMKDLKKELESVYKKNKKNVPLVLEAAKAFYDNGLIEEGDKAVEEARKSDKSNALIYILKGDRLQKAGKLGDAAMQYDQAIAFDSNSVLALIKGGKVYENINPTIAIDQFKKAMEIDPSNKLINRYLAKVYSASGRYAQAIEIYGPYFLDNNFNLEDIRYFSTALYFNKNYTEAKEILQLGLDRDPENFVFNRLMMYTDNELKNNENGIKVGDHFFGLRTDSGYIDKDYVTYGHLLTTAGRNDDALNAYKKAIEINPDNVDLYKELASAMAADKMYEEAASFLESYIEIAGEKVENTDYYQLGRHYQFAGQRIKDTIPEAIAKRMDLLKKADGAFEEVTKRLPDSYLGYYSRASVNVLMDPDIKEGLAKPHYEKTLEIIQANDEMEQRQAAVSAIYQYMAIYNLYRFDDTKEAQYKEESLKYCDLALGIKPDDASILQIKQILLEQ